MAKKANLRDSARLTPSKFESALVSLIHDPQVKARDRSVLVKLQKKLRDNPDLIRGGPTGGFTYSDPELSRAVDAVRRFADRDGSIWAAGEIEGEELNPFFGHWIATSVRAFRSRNDKSFQDLGGCTPSGPVQLTPQPLRVAVVGDAGFRGAAQDRVIGMIQKRHARAPFDAVIHLGDIYFAASKEAALDHFIAPFSTFRKKGAKLFTLVGNHDLYRGGEPFQRILDTLVEQPGRYFLIESPKWRIVCLDTSFGDPSIARNRGKLDLPQLNWLRGILTEPDPRPVIVLSHHYILSAWEQRTSPLETQVKSLFKDSIFAWYWGHEHRCATYERLPHGFYGACVGNGAFVEPWAKPASKLSSSGFPSWYATGRCECYRKKAHFWPHGFLELELADGGLTETYHLENGADAPHKRVLKLSQ